MQLGGVISQDDKLIAFFSKKLNSAQVNYTVTERKLFSIVETLKHFRNIVFEQQIKVFTDHKNLTYKKINTEQVMQWRLTLEEYNPELIYIQDSKNIAADALSRLDKVDIPNPFKNNFESVNEYDGRHFTPY